jgi:predicted amidohydrolase
MARIISEAAGNGADVVVFPELAVTGAVAADITRADTAMLDEGLAKIRSEARRHRVTVLFGMPHVEGTRRWNAAFVVGPEGDVLTRYDQMVVDRRDLFEEGSSARSMWFRVKGVPAVVTVGADARWNEIGELAAARGVQLMFNLSYDGDLSEVGALQRTQFWVQLASFGTFSATVNAADPWGLPEPSAAANGGSAIWEDFAGHKKQSAGDCEVFSQYSASRVVSAGREEKILYARRTMPKANAHLQRLVSRRYPHMEAWYHLGARVLGGDP